MAVVLTELLIGDDPAAWEAAGFTVDGDHTTIGTVQVRFAGSAGHRGVLGWSLSGLEGPSLDDAGLDGVPTTTGDPGDGPVATSTHPNGVTALDHVVVVSPDLGRTIATLESHGIEARRARDAGTADAPRRQVFFWIGEPILELVGPPEPTGDGPARIYGLACTAPDLDTTAANLGDRVGRVKDAVQPGRRITTLRHRDLDMSVPVAFMSPHVRVDTADA